MTVTNDGPIVLAGGTGDLGARIATALGSRHVTFRAVVRPGTSAASREALRASGATPIEVDYDDASALRDACDGTSCVISALNGLEPVMIGMQGNLLDAAIAVGVPRFIPSDFSLDYTKTRPGDNRNMDVRRKFMAHIDGLPIRATSVLNGAFADLLTGQAPIVLEKQRKILYWGSADQRGMRRNRREVEAVMSTARPLRVIVAKAGLDGHDRGAKVIARALRDAGMEVIYTGLFQTPEQIVATAIQEDADGIGLSILSGAHMTLFPAVIEQLRAQGAEDVVFFGGGTIPADDVRELKALGVREIFTPGAPLALIVSFVERECGKRRELAR